MQISDIVSPTYSISSNALKLNSSSVAASTPGYQLGHQLVQFQQFPHSNLHLAPKALLPKKRLTIDIDEINDFQQQVDQRLEIEEEKARVEERREQAQMRKSHGREARAKVRELELDREGLVRETEQLRQLLAKKEEKLEVKQQLVESLTLRLAEVESSAMQDKFYDEKLREKEGKYRQLQKVHEKVVAMNKSLQRDLQQSEKKIMELERELQKSVCATQYENMIKVKESSVKLKESSLKVLNPNRDNKQNTFTNTVKSLERKKPSTQPKKTSRVTCSTLNLAKKMQIKS